jgi:hypothetical protein
LPSPESITEAFLALVAEECSRHGEILGIVDLLR